MRKCCPEHARAAALAQRVRADLDARPMTGPGRARVVPANQPGAFALIRLSAASAARLDR
jgi:hypothetical protein